MNISKVFLPVILFVAYLILDYINAVDLIGLSVDNINVDIFGALINGTIVIVLYIVSFYYIDNKQLEKDKNAKCTAQTLLKKTYSECLESLKLLDNKEMVKKYVIPKVNGNKPSYEDKIISNFQTCLFYRLKLL